ncbi:MAG: pyrroline-5-carboxylate reductase [Luteimonas sp.]
MTTSGSRPPSDALAFLGGGNMARGLVAALVADGVPPDSIRVAEPVASLREALHRDFGVAVFDDNVLAVAGSGTWLFATKPHVLRDVCRALAPSAQVVRPLVVSIAAGVTTAQIADWLGSALPIVRAMPNMAAMLGAGVTGLYANANVDPAGCRRAERLLSRSGEIVWLSDETRMDAVTAVSGSGPAYVFLLAEAMFDAARAQGLSHDTAHVLVRQTILGAARMLSEDIAPAAHLRQRVSSPGGTTQAAVDVLESGGFRALVERAIDAATVRGRELAAANG